MTDGTEPAQEPVAPPSPLPNRAPRPWYVHWGVDALVAFAALVVVTSFFGATLTAIAVVAVVLGACAVPFTRRAEHRGLSARR
ncbi:MAG: hypothetical protein U0V73_12550 [Acidimicrobiia bacterium]